MGFRQNWELDTANAPTSIESLGSEAWPYANAVSRRMAAPRIGVLRETINASGCYGCAWPSI